MITEVRVRTGSGHMVTVPRADLHTWADDDESIVVSYRVAADVDPSFSVRMLPEIMTIGEFVRYRTNVMKKEN